MTYPVGDTESTIGPAPTVPDNGGYLVTLTASIDIPDTDGIVVCVTDGEEGGDEDGTFTLECYSGVIGNGYLCYPDVANPKLLKFVLPPLPIGGPYSIHFTPVGGSRHWYRLNPAITAEHRAFATNLFSLRGNHGPPRNVGPRSLKDCD